MKIVKVPLRISFFCAGTDLPSFYHIEKGAALNATIDKYINVIVAPVMEDGIHLSSPGHDEFVDDVTKMEHHITRETLRRYNITSGLTISSIADIKCRGTGLGASSAYTVGLIQALDKTHDRMYLPNMLAEKACDIEIRQCGYYIGKQDAYTAALSGMNLFEFHPDENVTQTPIVYNKSTFEERFLLVDTGIARQASTILKTQSEGLIDPVKFQFTKQSRDLAYEGRKFIVSSQFDEFGDLLNTSWQMKKSINSSTSSSLIDEIYDEVIKAGSLGGKVLGAGGGGYMLFYVRGESYFSVITKLEKMDLKYFRFKFSNRGAYTVYSDE